MKKTTVLVGVLLILALWSLSLTALAQQAKNGDAAYTDLTPFPNPANAAPFVADRDESCRENETPGATCAEETTGMEFVFVPGDCFQMGQTDTEKAQLIKEMGKENYEDFYQDELPRHEVCIKGFWMGKYEVTQAQWEAVMQKNPSRFTGANRPVEQVSWNDVQEFLQKLNEMVGNAAIVGNRHACSLRLPTEAEWEYAARAGTQTVYAFGDDPDQLGKYAWYADNSGDETHAVGQKKPNAFGLYDMHGNVREWCQDSDASYSDTPTDGSAYGSKDDGKVKLLRGGSWGDLPDYVRIANRDWFGPDNRYGYVGLRVVAVSRTP